LLGFVEQFHQGLKEISNNRRPFVAARTKGDHHLTLLSAGSGNSD
jgi:hypothetical protein